MFITGSSVLKVTWGGAPEQRYPVNIRISSYDRAGLLSDITRLINGEGLSIGTLKSSETKDGIIDTEFSTEVLDMEELSELLSKLCQIENVVDARRLVDRESNHAN